MEGRNGDAAQTDDGESSSSTEADEKWLSGNWLSEAWLSRTRFPEWTGWTSYQHRTATAVLLSVVLIAAFGGGGYYWYLEVQEERHHQQLRNTADKLGEPIHWPTNTVTTLDARFQLVTKWIAGGTDSENAEFTNGEMKYKLMVYGYPEALENAWSSELNSSYFVTVQLLDADGFQVSSIKITLDQLTRTVNPKGEGIGFSVQGSEMMSLRKYRRIDDWKLTWNL